MCDYGRSHYTMIIVLYLFVTERIIYQAPMSELISECDCTGQVIDGSGSRDLI